MLICTPRLVTSQMYILAILVSAVYVAAVEIAGMCMHVVTRLASAGLDCNCVRTGRHSVTWQGFTAAVLTVVLYRCIAASPPACRFSFSMLQRNHERNFSAFCSSLQDNIHTVIVDNTNILRQYYERYEEEAEEQGYKGQIEVIGEFSRSAARVYAARNVHGVPYEKVMQMLEQWQEIEEDGGCTDGYDSVDDFSSEDEYCDDY